MFKNLKLNRKLIIVFVLIASFTAGVVGIVSHLLGTRTLEEENFNKLTAIRELKAHQIEEYFEQIRNQVITFSESKTITEAMFKFNEGYSSIDNEYDTSEKNIRKLTENLNKYYKDEFVPRLESKNIDLKKKDFWPETENALILQNIYIANNKNEVGKNDLLIDAENKTSYANTHKEYHPLIRNYLKKFGYYDIFLVDIHTGNIVYSVYKEVDFGTSLITGPYKNTNFAKAFKIASEADQHEFVILKDYEPYMPSYFAPASFIASPIFDNGKKIGVLVFQMPIDAINQIMTDDSEWEKVGLGSLGISIETSNFLGS